MRRFLEAAGVDYVQWRALARAYVRLDFAALRGANGPRAARQAALQELLVAAGFGAFGAIPAAIVWLSHDSFFAATVTVAATVWLVGTLAMAFVGTIASPTDYAILGHRPVTSQTYLAARTTGVLVNAAEATALFGYLPVVAFVTARHGSWLAGLGAIAAIAISAVAVTLASLALYAWMVRALTPSTLKRVLALAGIVPVLGLIGGYALVGWWLAHQGWAGVTITLEKSVRTMWFPPTWFASYVEIARGEMGLAEVAGVALTVLVIGALLIALRGRLATDYSAHIGLIEHASEEVRSRHLPGWLKRSGHEMRAVALVARGLLRSDLALRGAVIADLMVLAGLLIALIVMDPVPDPFLPRAARRGYGSATSFLVQYGVVYLPASFHQQFVMCSSASASWVFFTTAADPGKLITAGRDVIARMLLVPLTVALFVYFSWSFGRLDHAAIHALFLGTLSYVVLQLMFWLNPKMPFSVPVDARPKNPFRNIRLFAATTAAIIVCAITIDLIYPLPFGAVAATLAIAGLSLLVEGSTHRKLARHRPAFPA